MRNTLVFVAYSVPPLVFVALVLAVLLNGKYRGRNFFRAVYFAPWALSAVVAALLWWWIFQDQSGLFNAYLSMLGLGEVAWLGSVPPAWIAITVCTLWWTVGFNTIIFLAALQDIPDTLYEAASIDGANSFQQFWSITIPMLRSVITFIITITLLASMNLFAQPYVMTRGGPPPGATEPIIMRIYMEGVGQSRMGSAAAMSVVVAVILVVFTVINFRLFGRSEQQ
ncbi:MAG: sugar ABC transporter permease [Chloroflexia bacterium]